MVREKLSPASPVGASGLEASSAFGGAASENSTATGDGASGRGLPLMSALQAESRSKEAKDKFFTGSKTCEKHEGSARRRVGLHHEQHHI